MTRKPMRQKPRASRGGGKPTRYPAKEAGALYNRLLSPNGPFGFQTNDPVKFVAGQWRKVKGKSGFFQTDQDQARLKAAEEKRYNRRVKRQPGI